MINIDVVGDNPTVDPSEQTATICIGTQDKINHNNLGNLQGGTLNERYHLTKSQWQSVLNGGGGGGGTFLNGLESLEGGTGLGGSLTQDTQITTGVFGFSLSGTDSSLILQQSDAGTVYFDYFAQSGNYASELTVGLGSSNVNPSIDLYTQNGSGHMEIYMDTTNAMTIIDTIFLKGLEYEADYSTNFTDNSLVSKLYVDTAITNAGGGGGTSYTFLNGVNNVSGTVSLGGQLTTAAVSIDANNHSFTINDTTAGYLTQMQFSKGGFVVEISTSITAAGALLISPTQTEIGVIAGSGQLTFITTAGGGHLLTDTVLHKGIVNAGDYESNFVARSLVTKQYVDTAISGVGGGGTPHVTIRDNSTSNISFDTDCIYGGIGTPLTGDISFNSTNSPVLGTSCTIIHSDSVAPGFDGNYHILVGSAPYVTGVTNVIFCTLIDGDYIIYSISQPS